MKRLIVDLDGTITVDSDAPYTDKVPNLPLIERLRDYHEKGYEIVIHTSRQMRTFDGNIGKINIHTLPAILEWLERHKVPFDEVVVGKPWCGFDGFYIDDRCVRPQEFLQKTQRELEALFRSQDPEC